MRVLPLKTSPVCGACRTPTPRQTTAFTCVFRCFPCDPSCGSASWATPEFTPRSAAPMVKMTRSKTFQAYLPSCHRTYSCIHCRAHLANHDELISKVHVRCRPSLPTSGEGASGFADMDKLSQRARDVCIPPSVQGGRICMAVSLKTKKELGVGGDTVLV